MFTRTRLQRLAVGLALLLVTLIVSFAIFLPQISRWGATDAEVAMRLPGDELAPQPIVNWTNAIDIHATPQQVWPWIAQMGDTRGGFYSYTFIEDRVGSLMGATDYNVDYQNANRIVSEWQQPAIGDSIIQNTLKIREIQPNRYLLADAINPEDMQWTWVWWLQPINNGEQTRLIVRCLIQVPAATENPILTGVMNAGGFVMQQRMIHGLKLRAEGGLEAPNSEMVEIILWLATLLIGLIAARMFVTQHEWRRPLALAVTSVFLLVALTFIQPEIWIRVLINAMLLYGVWWVRYPETRRRPVLRVEPLAR